MNTAQNTEISPNSLLWKLCKNAVEFVPFHKISTPQNYVKLWYFAHRSYYQRLPYKHTTFIPIWRTLNRRDVFVWVFLTLLNIKVSQKNSLQIIGRAKIGFRFIMKLNGKNHNWISKSAMVKLRPSFQSKCFIKV